MSEDWVTQMNTNSVHRLALRLADGHCKRKPDWELKVSHCKGHVKVRERERNTWNKDMIPSKCLSKLLEFEPAVQQPRRDLDRVVEEYRKRIHYLPTEIARGARVPSRMDGMQTPFESGHRFAIGQRCPDQQGHLPHLQEESLQLPEDAPLQS